MESFIEGIPKAELHLHLEGTLEPDLKFQLSARNNVELPYASEAEMRAAYDFDDLPSFLAVYYEGMSVLLTEEDFYDLALAYFRRAHAQNVVYAEVFFDPQAHTSRGIAFETVINGIVRAQREADEKLGLRSQLIMCFLRDMTAESALETLNQADPFRRLIIGVGLDSDERDNPPAKFADVFAEARHRGYRLTAHCDVDQANSTVHIRQCLDEIGVDRIDHGVNVLDDPDLIAEVGARRLGLTVCPISNSYVTEGLKAEEIRRMLELELLVCVNSDDPAYFPGYMTENLLAVQAAANLSREQVARLVGNAFTISWLTESEKAGYVGLVDAFVSGHGT